MQRCISKHRPKFTVNHTELPNLVLSGQQRCLCNRKIPASNTHQKHAASVCKQANACICTSCEDPRLRGVECTVEHPFKVVHLMTSQDLDRDNQWIGHQVLQAALGLNT